MDANSKKRLYILLNALREDVITKEQFAELDNIVCQDEQAALEYVRYVQLWTDMHFFRAATNNTSLGELYTASEECLEKDKDLQYLKYLIDMENNAPALETPKAIPEPEVIKVRQERPIVKKISLIYNTLIYSAAMLLISLLIFGHYSAKKYGVPAARLTDMINTKWGKGTKSFAINDQLYTNKNPMRLIDGIAKIEFTSGVKVVIEGPAVFEINRESIFLEYGRLYSKVSETGLGFSVKTSTSQFVDHGTEFGILAEQNGSSELHVIKGKVQLFAGTEGSSRYSQMIKEDQAICYDVENNIINSIQIQKKAFVREISSQNHMIWNGQDINLADIVGGGNGFGTGEIGKGISLTNGSNISDFNWIERQGSTEYHKVNNSPYIDGVIVPDSEDGLLQVSSAGHTFKECPNTSGIYYDDVRNGGMIHISEARDAAKAIYTQETSPMMFNGQQYGTQYNPLLFIHSNACITFDLNAIRSSMPDYNLTSFKAGCGLLERPEIERIEKVDVFVLVDGNVKFEILGFDQNNKELPVYIPLTESDQYLTLVVTDGGDGIAIDWVGFIEPILEVN